jgi:hypothetical protein
LNIVDLKPFFMRRCAGMSRHYMLWGLRLGALKEISSVAIRRYHSLDRQLRHATPQEAPSAHKNAQGRMESPSQSPQRNGHLRLLESYRRALVTRRRMVLDGNYRTSVFCECNRFANSF